MSEALQALQEGNGLLPALIENLPGGAVFVVDRDLHYVLAQGEALSAAGFKPEDFVGQTIFEVLPPELATQYEGHYRRALAGKPFETEHNAHNHWYVTRGTPLRSPDGDVYAVLAVSFDITERKRSEDERQRREEQQNYLLKLSDALRCLANPVEIQEAVTRTAMAHFGSDRCYYCEIEDGNAIIRRDAAREDLPSVAGVYPLSSFAILQSVIEAGHPFVVQDVSTTDTVDEDLRQLCIQLQVISYIDVPVIKDGQPVGVLCLVQDTPRDWNDLEVELAIETAERIWAAVERAKAEQRLRTSEAKYRSLFESIYDGFALLQVLYDDDDRPIDSRFLEVSPSFETQTGLLQAVGKTLKELIPSIEAGWFEHYHQALVTNAPVHFEGWQDYLKTWFEVNAVPYGNPQDRQVTIVFRNINDRKQAEANQIQLIREQAAREQERQRAETLADLDRSKTTFFSNVSHEFRTPLTLSLAPLQDALRSLERDGGDGGDEGDRGDPLITAPSASPSSPSPPCLPLLRENLQLVYRNNLRLLKLVNTLLDFSRIEAGRLEAVYEPTDLAAYTAELASVFRSAIEQAGLQLIVDCPPLPEPVYIDRGMWEKIILNLLSNACKFTFAGEIMVSLSVESSPHPQASTVNSHDLTSERQHSSSEVKTFTSELKTSTSEVKTSTSELETFTSEVKTSSLKLQTLTSELKSSSFELQPSTSDLNASTSNPEILPFELETSHRPPHLLTPTSPHPHVILQIRDTGTGIAAEHLPHLFERFYQIRESQARTYEGSGIGLALVHELVQLQGGTIAVSSTLGQGTCFTITLPLGTAHLPTERIQATRTLPSTTLNAKLYGQEAEQWLPEEGDGREDREVIPPSSPLSSSSPLSPPSPLFPSSSRSPSSPLPRVLIVDDNTDMRQYLTRLLRQHVHVEAVADGTAALAVIQTHPPDLVLSDVMMPRLDGFGLLQTLRADPRTREIPVILLSARAGAAAIAEGLHAGADDYLIKPFSAQELVSRVNTHLQISSWRGEALHEARSTIRRKDELLSVVSHELNTPLAAILGWTRLLRANLPHPAMLSAALDTIEHSATMQAKLVRDLLDISRITVGKLRLHLQPTKLESVIERAIAAVTQDATAAGIDLTWTATTTAVVMGDQERLQQVVCNLLTNAIKFTSEGGNINVSLITAGGRADGGDQGDGGAMASSPSLDNYAEIRVTDTGVGIAPDLLPHVFEQFWQAGETSSGKGLGLGLAIAHHIVELHQGTIQAQSVGIGQGATFLVRLPLLQVEINNS
ncbi:MAG: response regulator [Pantanalinema sp. GBBB05]|nr:response regulator [Pantanalinema sp. GBBB05]